MRLRYKYALLFGIVFLVLIVAYIAMLDRANEQKKILSESQNSSLEQSELGFDNYIIDGNKVYWNDANVYFVAYPHTIQDDGYVYLNLTSKIYSGNADLTFGFDTQEAKPVSVDYYNPKLVNYTSSYTCEYDFNYTLSPRHFWCYKANNVTGKTEVIYDGAFEWGDIPAKTAYWNTSRLEYWQNINKVFDKANYNYGGMNTWYYINDFAINANQVYALRIKVRLNRNGLSPLPVDTKYWISFKPSGETIQQAITNGHLYALDPWVNSSGDGVNYSWLETNLSGWWSFDVLNSSGAAIELMKGINNITIDYPIVANGILANCVEINSTAFVNFTGTQILTKISDNPFSLSIWIRPAVYAAHRTIVDMRSSREFILDMSNPNLEYLDGTGGWINGTASADLNVWTHIVFTFNGSVCKIYKNGSLAHTRDCGIHLDTGTRSTLGTQYDLTNDWNGRLDELGIWNNMTLNSSDVATLYSDGLAIQWNNTATYPTPPSPPNDVNVALYSPTEGYVSPNSNVSFLCKANSTSNGIVNLTLIINESDVKTIVNDSAGQNLSLAWSYIFNDGSDNYTCKASSNINETKPSNVNFKVDTIFPSMNITFPKNITYTTNVTALNYTYVETNPDSCWIILRNVSSCYQEFANVSTSCGGLGTGNYAIEPLWDVPFHLYDGDWSTSANSAVAFTSTGLNITYFLPSDVTNVTWEIKDSAGMANYTIPARCVFSNSVKLEVRSDTAVSSWNCWNSTGGKENIRQEFGSADVFEEAIILNYKIISIPMGTNFTGIINSSQGNNFWNLTCNDTAGHTNSTSISFYVDSIAPFINITYPKAGENYTSVVGMNYTLTETNPDTCWWSNDSGVTNMTLGCGVNVIFNGTEGFNNWTIWANDTLGNVGKANVTFIVHSLAPIITIIYPNNYSNLFMVNNLTMNVSFQYSIDEMFISTCWWDNGTGNTSYVTGEACRASMGMVVPTGKEYTFIVWVNDSFNRLSHNATTFFINYVNSTYRYNTPVEEGTLQVLKAKVVYNNNTNSNYGINYISDILSYNNTNSSAISTSTTDNQIVYSYNVVAPSVTATNNVYFHWIFDFVVVNSSGNREYPQLGVNMSNNQFLQVVSPLSIENCTDMNRTLFNISMVDEETLKGANGTIELAFYMYDVNRVLMSSFNATYPIRDTGLIQICSSDFNATYYTDYVIKHYVNSTYFQKYRSVQNMTFTNTTAAQVITLYNLLLEKGFPFKVYVVGNLLTSNGNSNLVVEVQKKYVYLDKFILVESPITSSDGTASVHLVPSTEVYNFVISYMGQVLGTFNNNQVTCQNPAYSQCSIVLNLFEATATLEDFTNFGNVSLVYLMDAENQTMYTTFRTTDSQIHSVNQVVYLFDAFGNQSICNTTILSVSGTFTCVIPAAYGNKTLVAQVYSDGKHIANKIISSSKAQNFYGVDVLLELLTFATLVLLFISHPVMIVIGAILGVLFSLSLIFITQGSLSSILVAVAYYIIAGGIIIWQIAKRY